MALKKVKLIRDKLEPKGSTATAYCWLVWCDSQRGMHWIPPCRKALERPGDYEAPA